MSCREHAGEATNMLLMGNDALGWRTLIEEFR
jgi:hypothetical protein